jgi:hypothetical protein
MSSWLYVPRAEAGPQERGALDLDRREEPLLCSGLDPGMRRGTSVVKQINAWPMLALLVVVLFIIFWLSGGLAR